MPPLPNWMPLEAWNAFLEMRKKQRKQLTPYGVRLAVKKLEDLRAAGNDPKSILETSILGSYQGLFEPRVSFAAVRAAEQGKDAQVGRHDPNAVPREKSDSEKAELAEIELSVNRWDDLEKGTLAITPHTMEWAEQKLQGLQRVRAAHPSVKDKRLPKLAGFLQRAGEHQPQGM